MWTVFDPQTDGVSEILNKQIMRYIQTFTTHHHDLWDTMYPLAESACNTATDSSTDCSPFNLDLGYSPSIWLELVGGQRQHDELHTPEGTTFVEQLKASWLNAQDCLRDEHDSQIVYGMMSRSPWTLEVGDFLTLSAKDLPMIYTNQGPSWQKLQHPEAGPYKIVRFWGPNAVKLKLPADRTIHDTASIHRLTKYTTDWVQEQPPPPHIQTVCNSYRMIQPPYVVEVIRLHKQVTGIKGGCLQITNWMPRPRQW